MAINVCATSLDAIKNDWAMVEPAFTPPLPFQCSSWAEIWWKYYGANKQEEVVVARHENNDIAVIAPFYLDRVVLKKKVELLKTIRIIGAGEFSYSGFGLVKNNEAAISHVWRFLRNKHTGRIVLLNDIPEEQYQFIKNSFGGFYRVSARRSSVCPRILFGNTWDEYWKSLGKSTKKNIKWYRNKLSREESFTIELIRSFDEDAMKELFRLHYLRWNMNPVTESLQRLERYETDIARMLGERSQLALWFLSLYGKKIAAMLTYDYRGVRYYHKGGYDPEYKELSAGIVLLFHTIKQAFEQGIKEYDFLRGDEEYKKHFSNSMKQNWSIVAGINIVQLIMCKALLRV